MCRQVVSMQNIRKSCVCAAAAAVHSFAKNPASTDRVVEGARCWQLSSSKAVASAAFVMGTAPLGRVCSTGLR